MDLDFPICILKMNLECSEDLPSRIKKLLRKVEGVKSIIIDPVKGLILVSGTAQPSLLIQTVEKIGQSPQLLAYERDPTMAKTQFRSLLKRYAKKKDKDKPASEPAPEPAPAPATATNAAGTCSAGGFGYAVPPAAMQMPPFTLPPRTGPLGWLAPGDKPRMLVQYEEPKVTPRKTPAPYPYNYYEDLGFPKYDSPWNIFSDDNPQPCTIM